MGAPGSKPLRSIEIVVTGRVADPGNRRTEQGSYESTIDVSIELDGPSLTVAALLASGL